MRYRGDVEQARKDLRDMGYTPREARERAPRLAKMRQSHKDVQKPYSWLGCRSADEH